MQNDKQVIAIPIGDIIRNYLTTEESNLESATSIPSAPEEEAETNPTENFDGTDESPALEQMTLHDTATQHIKNEVGNDRKIDECGTEEFGTDRILIHQTKKSKKHQYSTLGELLYRICWYDFGSSHDIWKPIAPSLLFKVFS